MKELLKEFKALKIELFGDNMLAIQSDDSKKWKRYDQLLAYFHPEFRTKNWINPINH